ncbi:hypothetical protein D3C73_284120 [compost metagenome]
MAGLWYRTGTVTLTSGSKNVTGYGTKWKSANPLPGKGSMLCGPDGKLYEVDIVADDTTMTLVSAYQGTSGPGQGYALVLMSLTIPQFSTQLSQFVAKNSLFTSQINKLLTATGDVQLTDPDSGLVVTVPSWSKVTSEGEGQTARAKVEADRSKTEADRAKANADLAGDIVAAAAMPLPDVWIPLTDSLRMLTGYGREVKVGDDVIARYVNFERLSASWYWDKSGVLKQAAVNEPRFEAKGLLIEGPSTNLHKFSDFDGTFRTDQGGYEVTQTAVMDSAIGRLVARFEATQNSVNHSFFNRNVNVQAGQYVTGALLKNDGAGSAQVWLRSTVNGVNFSSTTITFATGVAVNSSGGTYVGTAGGAIKLPGGWWLVWASASIPSSDTVQTQVYPKTSSVVAGVPGEGVLCAYTQLEPSPSPSSYIQTTGAAVTRAADVPYIPAINGGTETATVSCTVSVNWPSNAAANPAPRIFSVRAAGTSARAWDASIGPGSISTEINANNFGGVTNSGSVVANFKSGQVFTGIKTPAGLSTVIPSGRKEGSQGTGSGFEDAMYLGCQRGASTRHLNGHLRNLRIWHLEATDAQIKALR